MKKVLDKYSYLWFASLLIMIGFVLAFAFYQEIKVHKILNIEFSQSLIVFNDITKNQIENLKRNTSFDYYFIIGYSIFFILSLKVIVISLQGNLKLVYYTVCLIPGILDFLENNAILNLIEFNTEKDFQQLYYSARLKWATIIPFLLMVLSIFSFYLLFTIGKFLNLFLIPKKNSV